MKRPVDSHRFTADGGEIALRADSQEQLSIVVKPAYLSRPIEEELTTLSPPECVALARELLQWALPTDEYWAVAAVLAITGLEREMARVEMALAAADAEARGNEEGYARWLSRGGEEAF